MGTLLGITLFSAAAALTVDRVYNAVVDSAGAAAHVGRYAAFTGTWTAVTAASTMRGTSKSAGRLKKRIKSVRGIIGRTKDK